MSFLGVPALGFLIAAVLASACGSTSTAKEADLLAFEANVRGISTLTVMRVDGTDREGLVLGNWPAWSPDGERIVVVAALNGRTELRIVSLADGGWVPVHGGLPWARAPHWSPDGSELAVNSQGIAAIHLVRLGGDATTEVITSDAGLDHDPAWSPDGSMLAFASSRSGQFDIYLWSRDSEELQRLTTDLAADETPAWSPDGQELAFASRRTGGSDIYILDRPSGDLRRITTDPDPDTAPAWSPDGEWLAFASYRDGNWELYRIRPDGTDEERLTRTAVDEQNPVWQP